MKKAKIAVMVSGGGTNLQALIDAERDGKLPHGEIALVISNVHGVYALKRAEDAGIPSVSIKNEKGKQAEFESKILAALEEKEIDLIILAGFLSILSEDFVARYNRRIINIHPSLIPAFCGKGYYGLRVHEAALSRGVKLTGATVHYVNEIPDGGEIIAQKAVEVEDGDTPEILQRRVMEQAEWIILPQAAEKVCRELTIDK